MTTITAEIVADSISPQDKRLTTVLARYPRCIHAELMTHRQFSRNAASSRAIPVSKMIQSIIDDPFVPLVWGKNQKGMQHSEECDEPIEFDGTKISNREGWLAAMDQAVFFARKFDEAGYHKQIVNRLLEPFMHITVLISATEWSNFFALRCHPDAEPHIQLLAESIHAAMEASEPKPLLPGQWHLPFVNTDVPIAEGDEGLKDAITLSVARSASTSYKTVDGFDMTIERARDVHSKLLGSNPIHASPAEHQATPDAWGIDLFDLEGGEQWMNAKLHGNFIGWCQYRKTLAGECL